MDVYGGERLGQASPESCPIVHLYLDVIVVHRQPFHPQSFADTASRFALPLITTEKTARILSDWACVNPRSPLPGNWSAASHSLSIDDSHSDLAPARQSVPVSAPSRPSVLVSAPARLSVSLLAPTRIFVPLSVPAVVQLA